MPRLLYHLLDNDGDSYRLLQLKPGQAGDPIEIVIEPARLSQRQDYEAISYVWGPPENQETITADGEPLSIRRSLFDCLTVLRRTDGPRLLYADAVCINQADDAEKSRQVQMMKDIYQNAARVLAWLGPGSPETDALFDLAPKISAQDYHPAEPGKGSWRQDICLPSEMASLRATLQQVLDRDYWKRAWIIQECLTARAVTFYAGHASTSWDQFLRLHMMLLDKPPEAKGYTWGYLYPNITRFDHLAGEKARAGEYPKPLAHIAACFNAAEATDPRDMIYAFFGLVLESQPGHPGRLRVDYGATASELYFRAGHAYLVKDPAGRPHRTLFAFRKMLKLTPVELLDAVCELIDPDELLSPVVWIVGEWKAEDDPKGRKFRRERMEEGLAYMDCHTADFATLVRLLDAKEQARPGSLR